MMNPNGKKLVLWFLSLILCITACAPAFASTGDRVVLHRSDAEGNLSDTVETVLACGNSFYLIMTGTEEYTIVRYKDSKATPESFVLNEESLKEKNDKDVYVSSGYIYRWFIYNNDIYTLFYKTYYTGKINDTELLVKRVKLENGQIILEESDLPQLDLTSLIVEEDDYKYLLEVANSFTMGHKLILTVCDEDTEKLVVIDLQDGMCTEVDLGEEIGESTPGPDGNVLITRLEWAEDYTTTSIKINSINLADKNETELAELSNMKLIKINPCYDPEKDALYFINDGELWAMPHFDAEQVEAVNDCTDSGNGACVLSDGFVLVWMLNTVMIKNTDPAQRGSITLRIRDNDWGAAIPETIYDMKNIRGDISVVLQQDGEFKFNILQDILNRDSSTDIYVLQYESNEFNALRNRDYLPDLSFNEEIVENTNRLYSYIQDAVKQNGKIIGVPVAFSGETIGINLEEWKRIGGNEEELPKTWSQFFDWLESMPDRLKTQNFSLTSSGSDWISFRAEILEIILNQYEIRMEKKGETDYVFASPELCELVKRLNNLDYEALKFTEGQNDDYDLYEDEENHPLLETYVSSISNGEHEYLPLALSFSEEEEPVLPIHMSIAFMNPYSEHPQEVMVFLANVANNLDAYDKCAAYIDQTEPIRSRYYGENLKWFQEAIDFYTEEIKDADDDERASLEMIIKDFEDKIEDNERTSWVISPEELERYQKWQKYFTVKGYSFINILFDKQKTGIENEQSDYEKMFYSEESAKLSAEELLDMLDKKVRMIRMERN